MARIPIDLAAIRRRLRLGEKSIQPRRPVCAQESCDRRRAGDGRLAIDGNRLCLIGTQSRQSHTPHDAHLADDG
jgi:hypothetical protein